MNVLPKKSLGQNFLVNQGVVGKIISASELTSQDTVLEVGPGTGNLTRALIASGARIVAVEKDRRLFEDLSAEFSAVQIEIIQGDILKIKPTDLGLPDGYKIVANLPYNITSHFLKKIFEETPKPSLAVLMVQKEVARRIVSSPSEMSLLALSVQYFAYPKIVFQVSRGSFRPEPDVDSAVIKLSTKKILPLSEEDRVKFFRLARTAFGGKRKQLINTLGNIYKNKTKNELSGILSKAGVAPKARPETLSLDDWLNLTKAMP
ncbi:MAG: Ribosomal RNA small subunit methyltransferase A [Parcubacteria group bacterium GW2011_GWA1_47_11]|uniref:Ribosomal RNA small subunit methyltransferase A n=1 Tax=Candidatus Yanofskybacteria bacterium RIFCSPHIGHO2_01_FULL_48_25b TaxID=1802672 RepID=A0A1F8EZY2_9BACT|nr:MAG: Ribosomal RNA small subunit methyltransferase A [Parcubacteria group bacterium GW2011_GWA1_47_11]OGN06425.1 MAG: ribosomal RNA small subunit methyltransferase A [Candidatus Yanofskybacteria bacterium RIFCSPHIGHO2_01_FULL_48_25b]